MEGKIYIQLEGFDKMKYLFQNYEKESTPAVRSALRKGANLVKKAQAASLPPELKSLKSVFKVISVKKELTVLAGVFARGKQYVNRRGIKWSPWNMIYWFNYGTYSGRMSEHTFINARKPISAGRRGGIRGTGFMDAATERSLPQAQSVFEKDIEARLDKILKKYAV